MRACVGSGQSACEATPTLQNARFRRSSPLEGGCSPFVVDSPSGVPCFTGELAQWALPCRPVVAVLIAAKQYHSTPQHAQWSFSCFRLALMLDGSTANRDATLIEYAIQPRPAYPHNCAESLDLSPHGSLAARTSQSAEELVAALERLANVIHPPSSPLRCSTHTRGCAYNTSPLTCVVGGCVQMRSSTGVGGREWCIDLNDRPHDPSMAACFVQTTHAHSASASWCASACPSIRGACPSEKETHSKRGPRVLVREHHAVCSPAPVR